MSKADHPHQAALHLIKALKCCKQCDVSEVDLIEIQELRYKKDILAAQLRQLNLVPHTNQQLIREITELQSLIVQLRTENDEVQRRGLEELTRLSQHRQRFESQQKEAIIQELKHQKQLTVQMNGQLEGLMQKIRYLNRINNELIYNFCSQ